MIYPIASGEAEIEIEKSHFLSHLCFLPSPLDAKERLRLIRKEHPQARHIVWAFVWGKQGEISGKSDDGEPAGTAGAPTLNVLKNGNCSGAMITTIRYFGGIKLGTGGLVRAYTQAAQKAFESAQFQTIQEIAQLSIELSYPLYDLFQQKLHLLGKTLAAEDTEDPRNKFIKKNENFSQEIQLEFEFPLKWASPLELFLKELGNGKINYRINALPSLFDSPPS